MVLSDIRWYTTKANTKCKLATHRTFWGRSAIFDWYKSIEKAEFVSGQFLDHAMKPNVDHDDIRDTLKDILDKADLPDNERRCLEQHYLHGKTYDQIASTMSVTRQRAAQLVNSGLEKCQNYVKYRQRCEYASWEEGRKIRRSSNGAGRIQC
jgi:RNA polymerase sigma factor (sigma-70 family)